MTKGEDMDWKTGKLVNGCLISFSKDVYGSWERPTWSFLWTYATPTVGESIGHRQSIRSALGRQSSYGKFGGCDFSALQRNYATDFLIGFECRDTEEVGWTAVGAS